jgi:peptidoglycan/LPS O-acetylase OafA/YrhL
MFYHYLDSQKIKMPWFIQNPIDLLGLYAVSTFYVLSGCALFIVYHRRDLNFSFLREFWIKRTFRIVPLFWLVTAATIFLEIFHHNFPQPWRLFLNFSLLFSWLEPSACYATGAWSIGNEWTFYTLFPILIWALKKGERLVLVGGVSFAAFIFYAFTIKPDESVAVQWSVYINPLNQLGLFVGGFLAGRFVVSNKLGSNHIQWLLYSVTIVFLLCSYFFPREQCIHGWLRILLASVSIAWCYAFGMIEFSSVRLIRVLNWLGAVSYTIYLTHPLVFEVVSIIFRKLGFASENGKFTQGTSKFLLISFSILGTFIASHFIYRTIEKTAMNFGKSLAKRDFGSKLKSPQLS